MFFCKAGCLKEYFALEGKHPTFLSFDMFVQEQKEKFQPKTNAINGGHVCHRKVPVLENHVQTGLIPL